MELGESGYKGREARFMVLAIEPSPMPSSKRNLQRKVEETSTRAGLKTYTPNNFQLAVLNWHFRKK
jgi:hypothetical protein